MNLRDDDSVSAVALVMETSENTGAAVEEAELPELEGTAPEGEGETPELTEE
jgi:hypothetical protein